MLHVNNNNRAPAPLQREASLRRLTTFNLTLFWTCQYITSNFIGNELLTFLPNSVCRSPTVEYTVTRKSVDQDPVLFQKGFDPRLSLYPTRSHLFWWNMERFRLLDNARHILIFFGNVHRTQKFF